VSFQHRVEIPADSPFFAGHFPGHPILPGIAHPLLVARALGSTARITEVGTLKLRSPVRPGDVLDLSGTGPGDDGIVRFELRRGTEGVVSQGTFRIAPPEWNGNPVLPALEAPGDFPPISTLIPHQPPARLVRDVLETSAEALTGIAEIPAGSPFVENGRAPAFLGLEAAAQGAAALEALSRRDVSGPSGPRIGYLVGLRNARFHTAWLPAELSFRVTVRLSGSAPPLSVYEVTVEGGDGAELVRGTISTYITEQGSSRTSLRS
jgi:3-hydroxymyristoyl/3-hydroxydecanoyl-(acyl carrier protein) dehydratase